MLVTLLLGSLAQAAPPSALEPTEAPSGIRIAMRGIIENWHDPYIATRFRSGGLSAGAGVIVPVMGALSVDFEVTYQRVQPAGGGGGGEATFQLMPVSVLAEYSLLPAGDGDLELFVGAGPTITMWTESGQDPEHTGTLLEGDDVVGPAVLRGARPGMEARFGVRIDLGLVQKSLRGVPPRAVRAVELELYGARRFSTHSTGFNLNTWRGGAGVALRF